MHPVPALEHHPGHKVIASHDAKCPRAGSEVHARHALRHPSANARISPEQHVTDAHYCTAALRLTIFAHGAVTSILS